jgi:hypothetical protein
LQIKTTFAKSQLWFQNETGICRGLCNDICLITLPLTRCLTLLLALACAVATVYCPSRCWSRWPEPGYRPGSRSAWWSARPRRVCRRVAADRAAGRPVRRKRLILTQLVLAAVALLAVASSLDWAMLLAAMGMVGLMAVVVQVMVAHAATWPRPRSRGKR